MPKNRNLPTLPMRHKQIPKHSFDHYSRLKGCSCQVEGSGGSSTPTSIRRPKKNYGMSSSEAESSPEPPPGQLLWGRLCPVEIPGALGHSSPTENGTNMV